MPEIYWPASPGKPVIRFVDMLRGGGDARSKAGRSEVFFPGAGDDLRFNKPFGIAAYGGKIYVTDTGMVLALDLVKGSSQAIGKDDLKAPSGIALTDDRIYVGDNILQKIYVYDASGRKVSDFGGGRLGAIAGIAADEKRKRLIVSDSKKHVVFVFGLDGVLKSVIGRKGKSEGEFNIPCGVAVDRLGRIYVVDGGNARLQIFDADGKYLKSIGSVGSSEGHFARPKGVALDSDGHIYVLDSAFGNFQVFDSEARAVMSVGSNGTDPAQFMLPSSICIDENDRIYVVDQINKRVQLFQYMKEQERPG